MNGIQVLIDEHVVIKRMLKVIRKASFGVLKGAPIDFDDFRSMIDFVLNYADAHHHNKEEKFLFDKMIGELGAPGEKLVRYGMLIEHDFGRLYMKDLEEALQKVQAGDEEATIDVLANAVSYTNLLQRHIDKEDTTVFTFAGRALKSESLQKVDEACAAYEADATEKGIQDHYAHLLEALEKKYL